ncbi:hypothetical protein COCNU_09G003570 [Cocos nucifera]|uniref:Zinc finger PHD-type domain-containing protein n=1 Tax=Cocos nucifera TaxID=13894 RepID=A0A8K0IK19_COCNU|nr:hypothetical protein COCNU_09G003570 [Cocos nucifera]
MQVSRTQPQTTSDSENSAEIEDDVKVCDICGDAGQEELLAICSRCSDGAEHTYCMRVMLDKLPEGDWLCEECQLKEENENQKVDRSEAAGEMLEIPCLNEKDQSSGNTFNPNLESKEINSDAKGAKGLQSTQDSTMRHGKNVEVTSVTSNKVSDTSGGSTGITSPRKNTVLSHESSLSSLDVGKVKPVNPSPPCGGRSRSGFQSIAHSQVSLGSNSSKTEAQFESTRGLLSKSMTEAQFESTRGLLSKSASFNSSKMPKVKQLIESVPLRQKITSSSDSRKEGLLKTITKSASFKSTNSGCSTESANKIQSLDPLRAEDPKGGKQVKERSVINKKNSSMSDRPSNSPSLSASTTSPLPKLDIKFSQQIGKSNKIPDSSNVGTDRGSNNANNLGCKEVKKQSSFSTRTSGSTSNGLRKSEDQKTCQPVSNENVHASSAAADRACCKPDSIQQCSTPQAADSAHRDDKTKDRTFSSSARQTASGSSRILRCQRCNETGHTTQLCAVDKLRMSAVRPSAERNLREGSNKNSMWKDMVEAMRSKTRPLKNNKSPDQSEEISTSSADQNSEVTSKDLQSGSLSCARNLPSMEETADGQEILRRSADFSKAAAFHVKQKTPYQEETVCVPNDGNINTIPSISDELNMKPQMQILPGQASVLDPPLRASIIPKLEFIWQGGFKVLTTGGLSELCDGLQAHLSSRVSPKALEEAFKFPCIIHLEEVPRRSSWPLQFQENSPKEDNIALFFFAKDIDCYKNNYSKLLETMLKNDLALKGNMDGAELLIFPSNLLPENSQRWNNLLFLWGVFRERKKKSLDNMPVFQKLNRPNLNMEPLDQDLPAPIMLEVSSSSKISSHENSNKELSRSERSPKRKKVDSASNVDFRYHSFSGIKDATCNAQEYSFVKPWHQDAVDNKILKLTSCSLPVSSSGKSTSCACPESNRQMNSEQSYLGVKYGVTWLNNFRENSDGREDSEHICHVHASSRQSSHGQDRVSPTYSISSYCGQGTKIMQKDNFINSDSVLDEDPPDNPPEIDHVSLRPNRKPMQSNTMEKLSHVPGETILRKEEANCSANDEKESKKMKLNNGGFAGCSSREEILSAKLSSKVHPLSSSFTNDSIHGETTPESSRSVERNFFPVDSGPIRGKKAEDFIYLSSDDEDTPGSNTPDLKLALGGKKKSLGHDILPLFPPKVGEKSNQDKPPGPAVVDGDDFSASLSLSLAFPALAKEQAAKPVLKTEQMMPAKPASNTSFFFFHGYTDT